MSKDPRRRAIRSFLEAALSGGAPTADDWETLDLPEAAEKVARAAVAYVRRTARPQNGTWQGGEAREAAGKATADVLAHVPDDWSPGKEDPAELAQRVERGI